MVKTKDRDSLLKGKFILIIITKENIIKIIITYLWYNNGLLLYSCIEHLLVHNFLSHY